MDIQNNFNISNINVSSSHIQKNGVAGGTNINDEISNYFRNGIDSSTMIDEPRNIEIGGKEVSVRKQGAVEPTPQRVTNFLSAISQPNYDINEIFDNFKADYIKEFPNATDANIWNSMTEALVEDEAARK